MKARYLHDWQMMPGKARQVQTELAAKVSRRDEIGSVHLVAGVDISAHDTRGFARAAVVVLNYPGLELIESKVAEQQVSFPYVPGLLSFREAPLITAACANLDSEPDIVLVDGQGIAHPRRLGLASHLGLLWDIPTIGCAKSRLCGEHQPVGLEQGSHVDLTHNGEVIGAVLRTRSRTKPLYISIGHKVDLQAAITWTLNCCRGLRLPEPTRLAHMAAGGNLEARTIKKATSRL